MMEVYKEIGVSMLLGWVSSLSLFVQFITLILQVLIFFKGTWILDENEWSSKTLKNHFPKSFYNKYCFYF